MKLVISAAVSAAVLLASMTQAVAQDKKQLAFIVNAASDFWKLAEAGVQKAQGELPNYELQFRYPAQGTAALQNALMDDLVAAGTDAIMISSVDPKTSIEAFNRIAGQVPLFTTDSDAPDSNRIAYLGSSNTAAGVQAGEVAIKALPNGGKCMGFVGFLGADNAKERIAGFRQAVEGSGVELVGRARRRCRLRPRPLATSTTCWWRTPRSTAWWASTRTIRPGSTRRCRPPARSARSPSSPLTRTRSRSAPCATASFRRHRRPAAVRMGLSGHEADGGLSRAATRPMIPEDGLIIVPTKVIDKGQRRPVRNRPEEAALGGLELGATAPSLARCRTRQHVLAPDTRD